MAEADRIKPQVGAPSELNLLIWLQLNYSKVIMAISLHIPRLEQ